jgi:hypothetical protein
MAADRINDAVRTCLNHCIGDRAPIARLAEFCEALRIVGWRPAEVRAVETAARRMLEGIVLRDHEPCEV